MSTEGGVKRPIQHEVKLGVVWPILSAYTYTVHAKTNLLCFSSVKHKIVLPDKGGSAA